MKQINVAVIGAGWIGELRAIVCSKHPVVRDLYIVEPRQARGEEVAAKTGARKWVKDYRELLDADVDAVIISATPETVHYPFAREWLTAKRHVLVEKPMALTLDEADELIGLARSANLKFTVGYTQRFQPRFVYAKQAVANGTLGRPVSALISRHGNRALAAKIAGRTDLGPIQMESTHDIDLALWWMAPARPTRVYAQSVEGVLREPYGLPDCAWIIVTMDNGAAFTIGSNWNLPPEHYSTFHTSIELTCTDGALFIDDSHRDMLQTTVKGGLARPLASMPGEQVGPIYAGPMEDETRHFLDCIVLDQPVLVAPDETRQVMEVTFAAELSARKGCPIDLPL